MTATKAISAFLAVAALMLIVVPAAAEPAFPPDVEKLFAQPEDDIDVGRAALMLDKLRPKILARDPELDVEAYSRQIDDLAQQVKDLLHGSPDPYLGMLALDVVLYKRTGIHYDFSPVARMKTTNYFLSGLLDTKLGLCQTMSVLYIAVAQRAGLRVYPVTAPSHTFVRVMGPGLYVQDLDPTSDNLTSDDTYTDRFHITKESVASGLYLRTKSYRELLGLLVMNTGLAMRPTRDPAQRDKSIVYLEKAVELDPRGAEEIENLRAAYEYEGQVAARHNDMTAAGAFQKKAAELHSRNEQLGYIRGEPQ
jgi:regulator of sirC expression with transglutaminase-like and TPR domain